MQRMILVCLALVALALAQQNQGQFAPMQPQSSQPSRFNQGNQFGQQQQPNNNQFGNQNQFGTTNRNNFGQQPFTSTMNPNQQFRDTTQAGAPLQMLIALGVTAMALVL